MAVKYGTVTELREKRKVKLNINSFDGGKILIWEREELEKVN